MLAISHFIYKYKKVKDHEFTTVWRFDAQNQSVRYGKRAIET